MVAGLNDGYVTCIHCDANSDALAQVENAIEIAWNPTADPALKEQAFEFLNQLRTDSQGWQVCTTLFSQSPRRSDVVRHVALEIVNNAVSSQSLDQPSLSFLKDSLLDYVKRTYGNNAQEDTDSPALQNKLTQTLTYLFVHLYKSGWEDFITNFLDLTRLPNSAQSDNLPGVILYLRILGSLHDEIADVLLVRQGPEAKRNNDLKDLLRDRDMGTIANSWKELLAQYSGRSDHVVEMTLKVVAKWVSWTDISLIINQDMLNLLLPLVGRSSPNGAEDKVRNAAIDTFTEVVAKKMQPADKTELISFLNLRDIVAQLLSSPPLDKFKGTPDYDTDLAEGVAKLVNTIVTDIIRVLDDRQIRNETRTNAEQLLQDFLPSLLRLFSDEYDEICSTVIPSLTDLLTFLRRYGSPPAASSSMISPILEAIVRKMRYDETASWGAVNEQEEEAEFQELRKRLQILQKSVAAVDEDLYIEFLSNLVANSFANLDQHGLGTDWRDLDLALHEMYLFGELALPNSGLGPKSQPNTAATERLAAMMSKMVESGMARNHKRPPFEVYPR